LNCKICKDKASYFLPLSATISPALKDFLELKGERGCSRLPDGTVGVGLCKIHAAIVLDHLRAEQQGEDSLLTLAEEWADGRPGYTTRLTHRVVEGVVREAAGDKRGMGAPSFVPAMMKRAKKALDETKHLLSEELLVV
jgi:hypothetical protein